MLVRDRDSRASDEMLIKTIESFKEALLIPNKNLAVI